MDDNFYYALTVTTISGLCTGIGSCIAFFSTRTNTKFLSFCLGLSAGVMIYVSFVEIFIRANETLGELYGAKTGYIYTTLFFFLGVLLMALIDHLIPESDNPHEFHLQENIHKKKKLKALKRTGLMTAIAITIHNFPEGLAMFIGTLQDQQSGTAIAIAIAIHNIPEGISVSVPIYYATGCKKKAFKWSLLSGLAEPLGAIIGYLILLPFLSLSLMSMLFAVVAGIMVFISIDELLPAARNYGSSDATIYGFIGGMGLMAFSLTMFH